jgi:TetR/AcrR family transcriptional regulator, regulator of biofilm formation and stress response
MTEDRHIDVVEVVGRQPPVLSHGAPTATLPDSARAILDAARRILVRDGVGGLTMAAIGDEAGVRKSLITYHFGSKEGLLAVLFDSVVHDHNLAGMELLTRQAMGQERVKALLARERALADDPEYRSVTFELLPKVLRSDELRPRVDELWRWYHEVVLRDLDAWDDEKRRAKMKPLVSILLALIDGLSIQRGLDPDFDLDAVYELVFNLVWPYIGQMQAETNE